MKTSRRKVIFNHVNQRDLASRFLCLVAGVLAIAVCSDSCRAQSSSPEALVDDFVTAWNTHAAPGFERLYTADAVWVPVAEVRDEGRENIVKDLMSAHTSWARESTIALVGSSTIRKPRPDVAVVLFPHEVSRSGTSADRGARTGNGHRRSQEFRRMAHFCRPTH